MFEHHSQITRAFALASRDAMTGIARHLNAFNPFARVARGVPASTPEMERIQKLDTSGGCDMYGNPTGAPRLRRQLAANRLAVQKFIDKENKP